MQFTSSLGKNIFTCADDIYKPPKSHNTIDARIFAGAGSEDLQKNAKVYSRKTELIYEAKKVRFTKRLVF